MKKKIKRARKNLVDKSSFWKGCSQLNLPQSYLSCYPIMQSLSIWLPDENIQSIQTFLFHSCLIIEFLDIFKCFSVNFFVSHQMQLLPQIQSSPLLCSQFSSQFRCRLTNLLFVFFLACQSKQILNLNSSLNHSLFLPLYNSYSSRQASLFGLLHRIFAIAILYKHL